jgi:large subunit ribosomal protein L15
MAVHKQKKNIRQRAKTTHGWGSMKKHRGAGHRGGRGLSGSGKRSDQRKTSLWKDKKYFGKYGFTSKSRMPDMVPINIKTLEDRAEALVKKGLVKFENGAYVLDLADLGYNKLLSAGNATKKLIITTAYATEKAVEKVKKAGGDVNITAKKSEPAPKQAEQEAPEQTPA